MTANQTTPQILIDDLTVKYGDFTAVKNLSLDIADGELLVLLGPSGCGKTTTMRCVAGLEVGVGGEIDVGGTTVFSSARNINIPANNRNIGMVFQSYAIWPHKTVAQNVGFPLKVRGVSKADMKKRVDEVLTLVGLDGYGGRGASLLSGGQMQRVALGRSLVAEPNVLLMDEPLSNLDAKLRDRLRFELKALQKKVGVTSIYVTHDQAEAFALADRIAVMHDGEIVQLDAPEEIYRRPASRFVADFLGITNIFPIKEATRAGAGTQASLQDYAVQIESTDVTEKDPAYLTITSESVALGSAATEGRDVNTYEGRVQITSFLGARAHYRVELESGLVLDAETSKATNMFKIGDRVPVHIAPDDVRLLEA